MTRALEEQWRQLSAPRYVRDEPVMENPLAAIGDGEQIIELIGGPGPGKSALLHSLDRDRPNSFDGKIE